MQANGLSSEKAGVLSKVSPKTVASALKGNNIMYDAARSISDGLNADFSALFDVIEDERPLSNETIAKYRRTIRAVLGMAKR